MEVPILSNRLGNLKEHLICVGFEQTKCPEGEDENNAERHCVLDDTLCLVIQPDFRRRSQLFLPLELGIEYRDRVWDTSVSLLYSIIGIRR